MSKVYLLYGLGEGEWHGQVFKHALRDAGHEVTSDIQSAEIVISHSGGPYALPPDVAPKQLIMINPVYWPGKSWFIAFGQTICREFLFCWRTRRLRYFYLKSALNLWYIVTRLRHTAVMAKNYNIRAFTDMLPDCRTVIIRNDNDPWCTPEILKTVSSIQTIHKLPGEHDDCWINPKPYTNLME